MLSEEYCGSEISTIKPPARRVGSVSSVRSYGTLCYVNSATFIADNDSSDEIEEDEEKTFETEEKSLTFTSSRKLDLSPEAVKKRAEVYQKWLDAVTARDKERKRLARERLEAELEKQQELAEIRKQESFEKIQKWEQKKKIEADKKMARLMEMKKKAEAEIKKPKEFKKAVNFQDWLQKKNEAFMAEKQEKEEKKKFREDVKKCRQTVSSASFDKWVRVSASKPKPVPLNRGLDSLRGSTTDIYVNPNAWQSTDDWD